VSEYSEHTAQLGDKYMYHPRQLKEEAYFGLYTAGTYLVG